MADASSLEDWQQDALHRVFLPTTEEEWHLDPNAAGLEALPMLGYEEVEKIEMVRAALAGMDPRDEPTPAEAEVGSAKWWGREEEESWWPNS